MTRLTYGRCFALALTYGCGTIPSLSDAGNNGSHDATPHSVDAGSVDADEKKVGTVTVNVTSRGNPAGEVRLALHSGTGISIADQVTGATGQVVFTDVPAGSLITLATLATATDGAMATRHLMTIAGVNPGDTLSVNSIPPQPVGVANLSVRGSVSGAASYRFSIGDCRSSSNAANTAPSIPLISTCVDEGIRTFAVQAIARDSAKYPYLGGKPLGYAFQKDLRYTEGGTSVELGEFATNFDSMYLDPLNVPTDATATYGAVSAMIGTTVFEPLEKIGGALFGANSLVIEYPPNFADRLQVTLGLAYSSGNPGDPPNALRFHVQHTSPSTSKIQLDMSQLLPRVRDVVGKGSDNQPVVAWGLDDIDAASERADVLHIMLAWPPTPGPGKNTWQVLLPPDAPTSFAFPALPPSLVAWQPSGDRGQTVRYLGINDLFGFEAIKAHLGEVFGLEPVNDLGYPIDVSAGGYLEVGQ